MRRTTTAVLIASALTEKPDQRHWGYDLIRTTGLASGTLYPILSRMVGEGLIEAHDEPADEVQANRPARRYYTVTDTGRSELPRFVDSWRRLRPTLQSRSRAVGRMPERFMPLAKYNDEIGRGIVHTDEWKALMAALQSDYNEWAKITAKVFM